MDETPPILENTSVKPNGKKLDIKSLNFNIQLRGVEAENFLENNPNGITKARYAEFAKSMDETLATKFGGDIKKMGQDYAAGRFVSKSTVAEYVPIYDAYFKAKAGLSLGEFARMSKGATEIAGLKAELEAVRAARVATKTAATAAKVVSKIF